jgi:hypothetical protein
VSAADILAERTQIYAAKTKGSSFSGLAATDCSRTRCKRSVSAADILAERTQIYEAKTTNLRSKNKRFVFQ